MFSNAWDFGEEGFIIVDGRLSGNTAIIDTDANRIEATFPEYISSSHLSLSFANTFEA